MPMQQALPTFDDQTFDTTHHRIGTKGSRGECTLPNCHEEPVVSRHWLNPSYIDGWWGAYCQTHLREG
jgi:hypothetical protein